MSPEPKCPFCKPAADDILLQNSMAYVREDKHPVTEGHLLIIPMRHFASYFETTIEEKGKLWSLVEHAKKLLENKYKIDGFNIGINDGAAAGQTINHLHIHLIPRRKGDVENPRGGVRHVIPGKGDYEKS